MRAPSRVAPARPSPLPLGPPSILTSSPRRSTALFATPPSSTSSPTTLPSTPPPQPHTNLTFSANSSSAQAAAAAANRTARSVPTRTPGIERVGVYTSDRPLCRLPYNLDDPKQLEEAARTLPGYDDDRASGITAPNGSQGV